jgi:hypothetical protein
MGRAPTLRQTNKGTEMNRNDAGGNAGSAPMPIDVSVPSKAPISPAARKFAEYLARRMRPMIEKAQQERSANNETHPGKQ